jgi:glycosyltransferase involved in cell wall biosynthesis
VEGDQLVSIVIPTYREEDYLEKLLISIKNQTYSPIETIISDASEDDSFALEKALADQYGAFIMNDGKLSVAYGTNAGAGCAKGSILLFIDADCIMANDYVERMVNVLNNGAYMAHGIDLICDGSVLNLGLNVAWGEFFKPSSYTTGRGAALRTEDFWFVGGYSEDLDPTKGTRHDPNLSGRHDLEIARKIIREFGRGSVVIDRDAVVATYARRPVMGFGGGKVWDHRGYRSGKKVDGESWE